jgi:hypothetical protein
MANSLPEKKFRNKKSRLLREHTAEQSLFSIYDYLIAAPRESLREFFDPPVS